MESNDFGLDWQAFRNGKTIGTLAWVFHVQSTGILSRPLDQLLHYPVPKKPIENFSLHVRNPLVLPIRCLFQHMDSDANDFTGNHGDELYRRSAGVPQETHYRHGCYIHPKYDGEKYSAHSCFVRALSHPPPSPPLSLASHLLLLPSLFSFLFPITNPFHPSASQEQRQPKPSPGPSQ